MEWTCHHCAAALSKPGNDPIPRSESCPKCGADQRCCLNCRHYDANVRYECREHIQERVGDKERANFCDWFQVGGSSLPKAAPNAAKDSLLSAAEALFKKK